MSQKKIAILIHENDKSFYIYPPFITLLIREWERYGFIVEVIRGIERFINADVIIPHIDLTVIPDKYLSFLNNYPVVVNRHVVNISKSKFSSSIIGPNDSYRGPVIIKTDRNYGGLPERRLLSKPKNRYLMLAKVYADYLYLKLFACKGASYLDPTRYPVYESLKEVPPKIFKNKNFIVEKFLTERDGEYYCLRRWIFLGDRSVNVFSRSKDRIVKPSNTISIEHIPVPEELYSIRQYLKFDYGKFDYVLQDGKVVLFDVNRTMAYNRHAKTAFAQETAQFLAEGIRSFL
ncbi:MAG: hypothetical protein AB1480_00200 [Nitrospirota bacterium]